MQEITSPFHPFFLEDLGYTQINISVNSYQLPHLLCCFFVSVDPRNLISWPKSVLVSVAVFSSETIKKSVNADQKMQGDAKYLKFFFCFFKYGWSAAIRRKKIQPNITSFSFVARLSMGSI
jgi:hypothetical protein